MLGNHLVSCLRHTRDVSARFCQTCYQTATDWIAQRGKHDGYGRRRALSFNRAARVKCDNYIDFHSHEFLRVASQTVVLSLGETPFNHKILSLDVAEVTHPFEE